MKIDLYKKSVLVGGLGIGKSGSHNWTPQSLVVEDDAPTKVVMTGSVANTNLVAGDFTIAGFTVSSLARDATNKILTLTLSTSVSYWDVLTLMCKGKSYSVTNNRTYLSYINGLFSGKLVAFYPMNETTGTTANDQSGNSNNGVYYNNPTLNRPGLFGTPSVDFNSSTSLNVYSAGFKSRFSFAEGYVSVWVAAASWTGGKYLFHFGVDANNYIQSTFGESAYLQKTNYRSNAGNNVINSASPSGAKFFNIGVRWSQITDVVDLFINGIKHTTNNTVLADMVGELNADRAYIMSNAFWGNRLNAKSCYAMVLNYAPTDADILKTVNPTGLVCFEGDSRMDANLIIPDSLEIANTDAVFGYAKKGYKIAAVSGSTTTTMDARGTTTDSLLLAGKLNTLVVWIGINDYAAKTAQQIYDSIHTYCEARKTAGWNKIVLCTEIDAVSAGWTAKYQALNTLIRNDHHFCDAVADLGARAELQDHTNTTYFNADGVHLIDAGNVVVSQVIGAVL